MFASVLVAALGALPFFTQGVTATQGACVRQYTVKAGDTCNSIGAANNASTFQIMAINPSINYGCTNLMPNQTICLGTDGADCTTTYVVKSGDTCNGIETAYGLNSTQLDNNNPNIDENCYNIYTGEVLCVAPTPLVPDVPQGFFQNQSITTNQDPQPNTPYVAPSTPQGDSWEVVDSSQVDEGDNVPYCDEVGA